MMKKVGLSLVLALACTWGCSDGGTGAPKSASMEDALAADTSPSQDSALAPDAGGGDASPEILGDGGNVSHEPAGYKLITEYSFGAPMPKQADGPMGDGSGWGIVNPQATIISDPGGPVAATSMQLLYPKGWVEGEAPATLYNSHASAKGVYCELWWKASNPWEDNSSKVNKLFIWFGTRAGTLASDFVPQLYNGHIEVVNAYPELPGGAVRYPPNVNTTVVTLGVWHRVESTPSTSRRLGVETIPISRRAKTTTFGIIIFV